METYFDLWQRHHYPRIKKRCFEALKMNGYIESISGAITLAVGGVGSGVFPRHCVQSELERHSLREIYPEPKKKPLLNAIYIAYLANQRLTKRAEQVIDWFLKMHPEIARS